MLAYMCFYQDDQLEQAKQLVSKYQAYPVTRWADLFKQVRLFIQSIPMSRSSFQGVVSNTFDVL